MFNTQLFEFADFDCSNDYILPRERLSETQFVKYIEKHNLRIDEFFLKPIHNQLRVRFLPCKITDGQARVYKVNTPSLSLIRRLWDLEIPALQRVLTQYIIQSDLKNQYDNLPDAEKTWVSSIILGSKAE